MLESVHQNYNNCLDLDIRRQDIHGFPPSRQSATQKHPSHWEKVLGRKHPWVREKHPSYWTNILGGNDGKRLTGEGERCMRFLQRYTSACEQ